MNWLRWNKRSTPRRRRSWRPTLEAVEGRQLLSNVYVLGNDGALWKELGTKNNRLEVDTSVQSFTPDPQQPGYLYVEGTDHKLWLEAPGWQQHGRTLVDTNVQSFAVDPSGPGFVYVQRTDGTLWHEAAGANSWLLPEGRTEVDTSVQSFAVDPFAAGFVYVEGTDHKLWLEGLQWHQFGRAPIDTNVQSFAVDPAAAGYLFVEGTDHNLWIETPGWQAAGRTWVDSNVLAFAADPDYTGGAAGFSYLYVEGTNDVLWYEAPGWQQYGRTEVDTSVKAFAPDPAAPGYLYVEGTDQKLWHEAPNWQQHGRYEVDYSVKAFAPDPFNYSVSYVNGAITSEYVATRFEFNAGASRVQGVLGQAVTGVQGVPGVANAYEQLFQGGAIYWSPGTGARVVYGPTYTKYTNLGGPAGYGLPVGDEEYVPGMSGVRVANFQNGDAIYWSSATGAHTVYGAIGVEYAATAYETDAYGRDVQAQLGAPTSDEMNVPGVTGARMNTFQGGAIYWSPSNGAHVVYGAINALYQKLGGGASFLGLPTSDELSTTGGRISYFQHGWITWNPTNGAQVY